MGTTLKAVVYGDNRKKDGTYNVKIRITHNRRTLKVSTNLFVNSDDLTRGCKIKNQFIIDQTDDLIKRWRKILNGLGSMADSMDVKEVLQYIQEKERDGDTFKLDFIQYGREVAKRKCPGSSKPYTVSLNALERYVKGQSLDISQITAKFLQGFEDFLNADPVWRYDPKTKGIVATDKTKNGGRCVSLYLAAIRHIHNSAKEEFNEEEKGLIRIPQSPFKKYKVKKAPRSPKRAIQSSIMQKIIDLPDIERHDGSIVDFSRRDLARDCFLLSFGLAGMNAADLYTCDAQKFDPDEPVIVYKRKKTRTRRNDEAEMHIRIEPCIMPLVEKYKDPTGERLFCFHLHYSTSAGFTVALNVGLRAVEKEIGCPKHVTFYVARHSWATIARSKALNIDKYTVHEGLNHVDAEMKVTDGYIDKDWSVIWEANAQVLKLFDWQGLK